MIFRAEFLVFRISAHQVVCGKGGNNPKIFAGTIEKES
jgi:hypothetical protein